MSKKKEHDSNKAKNDLPKSVDGGGLRYNSHKAELHQVPTSLLNGVAKVLMYGAQKYEKGNFRRGMKWTIPYDCLQRHMMRWLDGEELDDESGLPHLYHAAANIAMLIEFANTCPNLDDRFKGAVNSYDDSFKKYEFRTFNGLDAADLDSMAEEFEDAFEDSGMNDEYDFDDDRDIKIHSAIKSSSNGVF